MGESGELEYAVCGVGLNLADVPFPPALRETAVSLAAALAAPPPPRAVLLAALLARLEAAFDRLLAGADGAALLAAYRERLLWVGEPVAVWRGREREEAIFLGVDQEGRALLRQGERTEAMASGEIHLRGRK